MSEKPPVGPGVLPDEVVWPEDTLRVDPTHIASGSGWDFHRDERGGGSVPERNPWREDPPHDNPAQLGIGLLPYRGPDRRKRPRRQ